MSRNEIPSATLDGFQQKLEDLRWRIDFLPEGQRPHLHKLANVVEQQHQRESESTSGAQHVLGELRLLEKHVKADAKAARHRARAARRERRSRKES